MTLIHALLVVALALVLWHERRVHKRVKDAGQRLAMMRERYGSRPE
jgi:hypothetical protein